MSFIKRKAGSKDIVKSVLEFDAVPTEGSHNLVESGAVARTIGNLGQPLQWKGPATVTQLNTGITGIQPGWTYTLTDAGTLTDGSIVVDVGDEVAWTADGEWFQVGPSLVELKADVVQAKSDIADIQDVVPEEASESNKLVTKDELDNVQESIQSGFTPKGEVSVSDLNDLTTQSNGDQYILTDSGTITAGSVTVEAGDSVAWNSTDSVWYKVNQYALSKYGTDEIKNLPTSITSFRTGDVLPVDGPSGTAKITFSNLVAFVHNAWAAFVNALTAKTSFATGDKIPVVNGSTAAAMAASKLLELTAQNAVSSGEALANVDAVKAAFADKIIRDFVTTDGNGNQSNINLFEQIIPIPASENQYFNKNGAVIYKAYIDGSNNLTYSDTARTVMFRVPPGKKYCVSLPTGEYNRFTCKKASSFAKIGDGPFDAVSAGFTENGRYCYVADMGEDKSYILIYYYNSALDTDDESVIRGKIEVCSGEHPVTFESYSLAELSFNGFKSISMESLTALANSVASTLVQAAIADNAYNYQYVKSLFDGSLFKITENVSSSYNFAAQTGKWIREHDGAVLNDASKKISELIQIPTSDRFVVAVSNFTPGIPVIAYYSDAAGNNYVRSDVAKTPNNGYFYVVMPSKKYKSFRVVSGINDIVGMYKFDYDSADLTAAINKKFGQVHDSDKVVVDEDVTNSYPITNTLKGIDAQGRLQTTSIGGCTDVFQIDFTKKLCITCKMNQYITAVAFYKDAGGQVLDSIYKRPASTTTYTNLVLEFPVTARSFRIGTTDSNVYSVHAFHYAPTSEDVSDRVDVLEEEVTGLMNDVAELAESSFLEDVIETVNAVKFKPTSVLYLGADLMDFAELSYDSSVWSVNAVNGTISYLGGSIDPIVLEVNTTDTESYALECTQSDYVEQTNTISISIGSGPKIDAYNGTNNLFVGAVSDGGYLKIYPMKTTNTFTLSDLHFRKKVSQGDAVVTKTYTANNVNCGNSDLSALDAKWNVAIGPTGLTQSAAVSLTRSIAIGLAAQQMLQSGFQNIAIGTFAMDLMKHGDRNIALGCDCLYRITFADDCVAIGKATLAGNPESVSWSDPSTWQTIKKFVAFGNGAAHIADGQTAEKSVYVGYSCGGDGVGTKCTSVGADIRGQYGKTNCTAVGYGARCDKSNQAVFGNEETTETKVFGDFIVTGTDQVKRRVVFNNDNTCSWEVVS